MKQLLLDLKDGKIVIQDVPKPSIRPGGVLVANHYSVISGGTELSTLHLARSSYLGKARQKPDMFMKVVNIARKQGPLTAYSAVMGRLNMPLALGYSSAGVVIEASDDVPFNPGDRVACGGQQYANHSDVVFVPKNLTVKVPDNVSLRDAAYTTIGSIAMQGIRNADVRLGENVVVIGLGLIGLLAIQILKAAGCRVFGVDIDPKKVELGKKLGMDAGSVRTSETIEDQVMSFTGGNGADSILITAATKSTDPLEFSGKIARKKARVVLVGVVGMEIPRDDYYNKELEFIISCSYGPGRYDSSYEELGHDYPIGYVRWTEKRNMESFLNLLSEKKIDIESITSHQFDIEEAPKAYDIIDGKIKEPYLGIVLKYDEEKELDERISLKTDSPQKEGEVNIGMVGAGAFATSVLLNEIKKLNGVRLIGLSAASGISSRSAGENYGFEYVSTNYKELLKDDKIDAILIATRNSLHAPITIEAVESGKHVFVEKPLAITREELDALIETHEMYPDKVIQVGFNRRYSPFAVKLKEYLGDRQGPLMINYRINAEHLPDSHWVYEEKEGSSRFITELCHFIDFCKFAVGSGITDSQFFKVDHPSLNSKRREENVVMTLKFEDGSVGSILYNTIGDPNLSKEYIEVFSGGTMIKITDFREMIISKDGTVKKTKDRLQTRKGHLEELQEFIENIKKGKNPFEDALDITEITLRK